MSLNLVDDRCPIGCKENIFREISDLKRKQWDRYFQKLKIFGKMRNDAILNRPHYKIKSIVKYNPYDNTCIKIHAVSMNSGLGFSPRPRLNPVTNLPNDIISGPIAYFLLPKEFVKLQLSCRAAKSISWPCSSILESYQLEPLIAIYLHPSLKESGQKALEQLNKMAFKLSRIEGLPMPGYRSLVSFFEFVEDLNLVRMMHRIHLFQQLPDFPHPMTEQIPKNQMEIAIEANKLREWIKQDKEFLKSFIHLNLTRIQLSLLPREISCLKSLKALYLKDNRLVALSKEIGHLVKLEELSLKKNNLSTLPIEIGLLKNLRSLLLRGNCIISLPKEVGQLQNLKELGLEENRLKSLEIDCPKALETLFLRGNGLIKLPRDLWKFKDELQNQKRSFQFKNLIQLMLLCFSNELEFVRFKHLVNILEKFFGKEACKCLYLCLFKVVKRHFSTRKSGAACNHVHHNMECIDFSNSSISNSLKIAAIKKFELEFFLDSREL